MKKYLVLLFAFLFILSPVFSQDNYRWDRDAGFVFHLLSQDAHREALTVLDQMNEEEGLPGPARDSIHYLIGTTAFELKELEKSIYALGQVSPESPRYYHAHFLIAFNYSYLGNYDTAKTYLNTLSPADTLLQELVHIELAGIALLEGQAVDFERHARNFKHNSHHFSGSEAALLAAYEEQSDLKRKSAFLAGLLSAVVPGSGKAYAGRWNQGLASFVIVGVLGAQVYELYRKKGFDTPLLYIIGGAFSAFYVGNIWGSALSVQIEKDEKVKAIHNRVLYHMHIPVRSVFR